MTSHWHYSKHFGAEGSRIPVLSQERKKKKCQASGNWQELSLGLFWWGQPRRPPIGEERGIIHLDKTNKISFKVGLGRATNSKAKLSALWAIMKIAVDKQLKKVHIYGDSKIVIDWETGKNDIRAPHLQNLLREIRALQPSFEEVHFEHIYRE